VQSGDNGAGKKFASQFQSQTKVWCSSVSFRIDLMASRKVTGWETFSSDLKSAVASSAIRHFLGSNFVEAHGMDISYYYRNIIYISLWKRPRGTARKIQSFDRLALKFSMTNFSPTHLEIAQPELLADIHRQALGKLDGEGIVYRIPLTP
jgi:hypothetical protein